MTLFWESNSETRLEQKDHRRINEFKDVGNLGFLILLAVSLLHPQKLFLQLCVFHKICDEFDHDIDAAETQVEVIAFQELRALFLCGVLLVSDLIDGVDAEPD